MPAIAARDSGARRTRTASRHHPPDVSAHGRGNGKSSHYALLLFDDATCAALLRVTCFAVDSALTLEQVARFSNFWITITHYHVSITSKGPIFATSEPPARSRCEFRDGETVLLTRNRGGCLNTMRGGEGPPSAAMASTSRVSRVGVAGALPPRALVLPSFTEAGGSSLGAREGQALGVVARRDPPTPSRRGDARAARGGGCARAQRALGRYRRARHGAVRHPSRQDPAPSLPDPRGGDLRQDPRHGGFRRGRRVSRHHRGLPVQRRPQPARRPRGRPPHLQAPRVIPRRHRDRGLPHATLRPPPPPPRPPPLRPPRRDQTPRRGPRRHALRRRQSRQSRRGRRGERRGRATSPVHLRHRPSNPRPEALPPKGRTQTRPGEYRPLPGGGRRERRGARRRRANPGHTQTPRARARLPLQGVRLVGGGGRREEETRHISRTPPRRQHPGQSRWARRSARRCGPSLSRGPPRQQRPGRSRRCGHRARASRTFRGVA